jgi:hypothetical protein
VHDRSVRHIAYGHVCTGKEADHDHERTHRRYDRTAVIPKSRDSDGGGHEWNVVVVVLVVLPCTMWYWMKRTPIPPANVSMKNNASEVAPTRSRRLSPTGR